MSSPNLNNIIIVGCIFTYISVFLLGTDGGMVSERMYPVMCSVSIVQGTVNIGGSKGGARDTPGVQILLFSCTFRQKVEKMIQLWELPAPPPENPGSATGKHKFTVNNKLTSPLPSFLTVNN